MPPSEVHSASAEIASRALRGQQACPPRGPTLREEGLAARLCRLERDESSPLAPKKQRGPPARRSYALLTPRTQNAYPNSEARLEISVVTKLQQWAPLDRTHPGTNGPKPALPVSDRVGRRAIRRQGKWRGIHLKRQLVEPCIAARLLDTHIAKCSARRLPCACLPPQYEVQVGRFSLCSTLARITTPTCWRQT